MTNVAEYQGRRFDLLAMQGAVPVGEVLLRKTLFETANSGQICTGTQKLAQRWVLEFMTIRGSMPFLPQRGTEFLREATQGLFRSELDVQLSFTLAMIDLKQNLRAEEPDDMKDDEKYARTDLLSVTLIGDFMSLTVNIVSVAGSSRQVILPIPIVPIRTTGTV